MTGSFNINSAQAAISNRSYLNLNSNSLNSEVETGNSLTKLPTEGVEVATFIRRVKIKKKDSVRYRVGNERSNSNKPAEANNSVRQRTNNSNNNNNNKPAPVNNPK